MTPSQLNSDLEQGRRVAGRRAALASAIAAILAAAPAAHAQQAPAKAEVGALEEVVVTSEKRAENLQNVPVSIEALGTEKLEELHVNNLDDYVKYLSGVTTVKGLGQGGNGIGTTHVYMRGVVSGQDGNHSASQPTVGTYFDEQPVTTIDGTIDIHVYDIERVEVLEGPQGTLYGASSEAGTIRIITNKPEIGRFSAAYDVTGNSVDHGGLGSVVEGYVNIPLSPIAAVRIVGWDEHDSGYISNVAGTDLAAGISGGNRSFPTWTAATGETLSNASSVSSHYNTVATEGGRAALKLLFGDNWTVTPTFMAQKMSANGNFGYDPAVGDLEITHFGPETTEDSFTQSALTVAGKINDFDITYAGGWLQRNTHSVADYSDYSYFYDKYYGSGANWLTQTGANCVAATGSKSACTAAADYTMPQEFVITNGHYTKWSQELRVSTPKELPVYATLGLFAQRQVHEIWEQYTMPGLNGNVYGGNAQGFAASLSVPTVAPNTIWLTDEERVDRDRAAFAEATWKISSDWTLTGGLRFYSYDNSLQGFYGYSLAYDELTGYGAGQKACPGGPNNLPFHGAPCTNLTADVTGSGHTDRLTLSYQVNPDAMLYATYSTGFRPGGVNRVFDPIINAVYPPYKSDTLTNYELGWKTQWFNHHLRWNGAVFLENWDNFQFSFLGPNSVTVVQNAASAQIKGLETNVEWSLGNGWLLSANGTWLDAKLTQAFCGTFASSTSTNLITDCPTQVVPGTANNNFYFADGSTVTGPLAPSGTRLPVVPTFKGNAVARYTWSAGDWDAHIQGAYVYQTSTQPLLFPVFVQGPGHLGDTPSYGIFDLSGGIERNGMAIQLIVTNVTDERAELTRFAQCTPTTCNQPYVIPSQPRTVAIKFSQKF